jgi:hypothetical protein
MGIVVFVLHEIDEKGRLNSSVWNLDNVLLSRSFRELKDNDNTL